MDHPYEPPGEMTVEERTLYEAGWLTPLQGATLRDRIAELEDERDEARQEPWPEWAEKLLRLLESWGAEYEADDEINLPDELAEWLHHYASDLKRAAAAKSIQKDVRE